MLEDGYVFEDIIANPWATKVIQCMLGPRPTLRFYSANTAFRAEGRQPPHIDVDFDFPKVHSETVKTARIEIHDFLLRFKGKIIIRRWQVNALLGGGAVQFSDGIAQLTGKIGIADLIGGGIRNRGNGLKNGALPF